MPTPLKPALKTSIAGEGRVVHHDQTRYGLRRLCISADSKYPDLEIWLGLMDPNAKPLAYRYVEKVYVDSVFVGYLWIFYKLKNGR
jgi:hypothetical protein